MLNIFWRSYYQQGWIISKRRLGSSGWKESRKIQSGTYFQSGNGEHIVEVIERTKLVWYNHLRRKEDSTVSKYSKRMEAIWKKVEEEEMDWLCTREYEWVWSSIRRHYN